MPEETAVSIFTRTVWIIIRRITVEIIPPKIDLFAEKERIAISHLAQWSYLVSENDAGNGDLPSCSEKIRIQEFFYDDERIFLPTKELFQDPSPRVD